MDNLNYLRAELSVLLVNTFDFSDKIESFQKELLKRFNSKYELSEIEEELLFLKIENDFMMKQEAVVLETEQFFDGF